MWKETWADVLDIVITTRTKKALTQPPMSVKLEEEAKKMVIWKQNPRRILGPKKNENGEWERFHKEELNSL